MPSDDSMVRRKGWQEFRESGLLWWVNRTLHLFGWAIVLEVEDDGSISDVYPARVKFRGFGHEQEDQGFMALSRYMEANAPELRSEVSDAE